MKFAEEEGVEDMRGQLALLFHYLTPANTPTKGNTTQLPSLCLVFPFTLFTSHAPITLRGRLK